MGSVEPNLERLRAFVMDTSQADDAPLWMLNLLKFRERASYADDFEAEPCTGREAYGRYMATASQCVAAVGGKVFWKAGVLATVIAPDEESWDEAFVVQYPNRQAFAAMLSKPEYQAVVPHRTAALADSRLIATAQT